MALESVKVPLANQRGHDTDPGAEERYRIESANRERLERELSAAAGVTLEDPLSHMGADSFRGLLGANEAFVDIVLFKPFTQDSERYAAIAMKSGETGEPVFIDLGKKEDIDQAVREWRYATTGNASELARDLTFDGHDEASQRKVKSKDMAVATKRLSDLVFTNTALQAYLGPETKKLWLCPEGEFGRIPWNAVAAIGGIATQTISEVDSPREFAAIRSQKDKAAPQQTSVMLLAGLSDFGTAAKALPGAMKEVSQIKALADRLKRNVDYLPEEQAIKESVKRELTQVSSAHIATHGFASGGSTGNGGDRGTRSVPFTMRAGGGMQLAAARNPLTECGLYFANPKNSPAKEGESANILTADEIIGLYLLLLFAPPLARLACARSVNFYPSVVFRIRYPNLRWSIPEQLVFNADFLFQ